MTKKSDYSYWVDSRHEMVSFAFANHVNQTAKVTGRPFACDIYRDPYGRTSVADMDRILEKSQADSAFTFDCAQRVGYVHLQQIGAMIAAAPTLGEGLNLLTACIFYFDDRLLAYKATEGRSTTFAMFYRGPVDASFYHVQAATLLLTLLDAWPNQYIENSVFHFPQVAAQNKTTLRLLFSKFPWTAVTTEQFPVMSWTVDTEQLNTPSPNFNPEWWDTCQKFLRWGLDALTASEPFRKAWCRFTTAAMMTDCKNLTVETACKLTGLSNKTMSKKLAAEGYKAADLKTWIYSEMAMRGCCNSIPEDRMASSFGYTLSEFRAGFKRRGVENPYLAPEAVKNEFRASQELWGIHGTWQNPRTPL